MYEAEISSIGETQAICPYCRAPLDQKPKAKVKCPHCGNLIYVRTRPHDRQNILVKESELPEVDYLWDIRSVLTDIEDSEKTGEYRSVEKRLKTENNQQPSLVDLVWHTGIRLAASHALIQDFCSYRNEKARTARYLQKLRDNNRALKLNLEVCYIDLNGPQTVFFDNTEPLFDKNSAELVPDIVKRIKTIMIIEDVSLEEVKKIFKHYAEEFHRVFETPVQPKKAWKKLKKELRA